MLKNLFLLLFLSISVSLSSQVSINEYSAANLFNFTDNFGRTEDWIEVYNDSAQDADISGYHLSDKDNKPGKWEIPEGTIVPAKGFLVFWCSGRNESCPGIYHTNFKLAQTKFSETLLLTDQDENIINEIPLQTTRVEESWGRSIDGGDEWSVSTEPTLGTSNNNASQFLGYTETPSMDMEAGFYDGSITVSMTNNAENGTLRYTTDGTNPTPTSPLYNGPITITKTTVVKAQSFTNDPEILTGKMDFNTYFINEDFTLAVFSVAADDVIDLANGQGELIPIGSLEYFNKEKVREATSFGSLNRHGQDSWVLDHRSIDWVSRDEMGYSKAVNAKLFSYSDRDEYQKFMFRNSGDDNYPAINDGNHEGSTHIRDEYVQTLAQEGGLKLDQRAVERVILFLNGEYWGVYGMRERPVDHDYTDYYYDQGKYDTQFLTTWSDTELQYGGQQALNDWYRLRDFIMDNDMGIPENYEKVKEEFNVVSLMDYMIVNLNSVASDWLNYNTGWWRGTNPDGDHKKWGYILWDLDATFDYYINYSGVPNISPDAKPCDIEQISDFMDGFFNGDGEAGPGGVSCAVITDPTMCASIENGSSPYTATDSIFQLVINQDAGCCDLWDEVCQNQYNSIEDGSSSAIAECPSVLDGSCPYPITDPIAAQILTQFDICCDSWTVQCQSGYDFFSNQGGGIADQDVDGNVGLHEKIFLKLQQESDEFRQHYYSRQADLNNTVYSCENMIGTLDRMLAVIEPEMPRQIERWGGSMTEWKTNVNKLKDFINSRCELFDDGLTECFNLSGPYSLTLMTEPEGVAEIDLNTLDIEEFPWTGDYFGNMENKIKTKSMNDDYRFSHWESRSGNTITPDIESKTATITLESADTLVAVYKLALATNEIDLGVTLNVYPNPSSGRVHINYELEDAMDIKISLVNMMGQEIKELTNNTEKKASGFYSEVFDITEDIAPSGVYLIRLRADRFELSKKISVIHQ